MGATCLVTTVPLQCLSLFCLFFNCAYRNIQHTVLYLCFGLCLNWPTFGFMPQSQSPWLGRPQCWSHTRGSHYCWHTPCNCSEKKEKKAFKYNQALAGFDCKREKKKSSNLAWLSGCVYAAKDKKHQQLFWSNNSKYRDGTAPLAIKINLRLKIFQYLTFFNLKHSITTIGRCLKGTNVVLYIHACLV